jgi:hypothetical protein
MPTAELSRFWINAAPPAPRPGAPRAGLQFRACRLCAMTRDEVTLSLTPKQLFDLATAVQVAASHGYGNNKVKASFSPEQFHELGGQMRLACNVMAGMGQTEMAESVAELLAYVEEWHTAAGETDPAS